MTTQATAMLARQIELAKARGDWRQVELLTASYYTPIECRNVRSIPVPTDDSVWRSIRAIAIGGASLLAVAGTLLHLLPQ